MRHKMLNCGTIDLAITWQDLSADLIDIFFPICAFKGHEINIIRYPAIYTTGINRPVIWVASWLVKRLCAAGLTKGMARLACAKAIGFKRAVPICDFHIFMQHIDM